MDDYYFDGTWPNISVGDNIFSIVGNVGYSYSEFKIYPRNEDDFSETLALINKYKAVQATFKRAEHFVNISYDSLGIFQNSEEKKILQNLTGFSLNRSF